MGVFEKVAMRPSRRILDRMWTESMRCLSVSTPNTLASECVPALNRVSSRPCSATRLRMFHSVLGHMYLAESDSSTMFKA
jgi:hypothetical protein